MEPADDSLRVLETPLPCRAVAVAVAGSVVTFADGSADRSFWCRGSGGTLEIALRTGDAAAHHVWQVGMAVRRSSP